jgi:ATP-dependent RNA helicase DeaD
VLKAKEKSIAKVIAAIIGDKRHEGYLKMVEGLTAEYSMGDIAAAALCLAYGEPRVAPMDESQEKGGLARLFMTIGRKDHISVSHIVKAIAAGAKIPGSKIGKIDVRDSFTFVEVPAALADMVIHSLDDMMMMGRRVSVKQAKSGKK